MTTPTGTISISQVQTEFGGAAPISLSEYYRGGVNVPSGQAAGPGGTVPTSGTISMSHLRGLTKVVAGIVNPLTNQSVNYATVGTSAVSVWVNFYTDGTIQGLRQGNVVQWNANYYSPTTASIGSSYWIRATLISGQTPSGATPLNTWLGLSSSRTWTYTTSTGVGTSIRQGTLQIQIATDSIGSNIVSSGFYDFYVEKDF